MFDVCGHSPLVKYFLKNKNLKHKKQHSTLVKRTEITEQPPPEALCYKDVLDKSKEFEKKNQSMFKKYVSIIGSMFAVTVYDVIDLSRHYRRQKVSMVQCQQTRKEDSAKHEL